MARRLVLDSDDNTQQTVDEITLCFHDQESERQYRAYQFELARESLSGRWGAIRMTTFSICCLYFFIYTQEIISYFNYGAPATLWRMIMLAPITIFALIHQFAAVSQASESGCRSFVFRFVTVFLISESSVMYINDAYADLEGCPTKPFRCPHSFSSPKFATFAILMSSVVVFHFTPSLSFLEVVQSIVLLFVGRFVGFVLHWSEAVSSWSLVCTCLQVCIFLGCRYVQELHDRRKFLMQVHILRLRSSLQELLDRMMPQARPVPFLAFMESLDEEGLDLTRALDRGRDPAL